MKSTSELISAATAVSETFGHVAWFRGHSNHGWQLLPSVYRMFPPGDYEANVLNNFRIQAPGRHANCPQDNDVASWICLMQHYGLPTRLLDWTQSVLVAAYFAVEDYRNPGRSAVWALAPIRMNELQDGKALVPKLSHPSIKDVLTAAFNQKSCVAKSLACVNHDVDLRTMIQQSTYTIHGSRGPLEALTQADTFLIKLEIPEQFRSKIEWELRLCGISRSKLFPDLTNLAKAVVEQQANRLR